LAATVKPPSNSTAPSSSEVDAPVVNAMSAILFAKATKFSFFATKSVSQDNLMTTPLSAPFVFAITAPSVASRSARFAATF